MATEKRAPGRPPTRGTARDQILRVRCSDEDRALMQTAADKAGQPLALWMLDRLVAAAKRAR